MNLSGKRTALWIVPPDDGATEVEEYRFVFTTCTMAGSGRYWEAMRAFGDWHELAFGMSSDAMRNSQDEEEKVEGWRVWNNGNNYAAIMACLQRVESRRRSLDDGTATEWKLEESPPEWESFEGFSESIPWSMILKLADAAHGANPGLWRVDMGDEAKKNGASKESS